jgi:hypothetical protein
VGADVCPFFWNVGDVVVIHHEVHLRGEGFSVCSAQAGTHEGAGVQHFGAQLWRELVEVVDVHDGGAFPYMDVRFDEGDTFEVRHDQG